MFVPLHDPSQVSFNLGTNVPRFDRWLLHIDKETLEMGIGWSYLFYDVASLWDTSSDIFNNEKKRILKVKWISAISLTSYCMDDIGNWSGIFTPEQILAT